MLLPDGDDVEAIASSHVPLIDFFGNCWHWSITQIVELPYPASHDGFANSCWNVWQCGPADTYQIALRSTSFGLRLLRQCERRPRCTLLPDQLDFARVRRRVHGSVHGRSLAYDPARGFLACRGEPGGGT